MSKKLLSEAVVRRFATLANLSPINEMEYKRDEDLEEGTKKGDELNQDEPGGRGHKKGDKAYINEDAFEDEAEMGAEAGEGELDDAEMGGLDAEAGLEDAAGDEVEMDADLGEREALAMDVISAVADALNIEVDIEGGEPEMDAEMDMGAAEDDIAAADDLEADAFADEEEAIMEALRGINYIPGKKEIVNEVAKRVARRLLKAKKADVQLKEALNTKRRRSPRRRRK
jgi:hypothetical protein